MGLDRYTFLGPYLKITPQETDLPKSTNGCPNSACPQYRSWSNDKFCKECGTPVQQMKWTEKGQREIRHVIHELENEGYMKPDVFRGIYDFRDIAMPNCNQWPDGTCWNVNRDVISGERIDGEINNFERKYEREIKLIREKVGYSNMAILWGFIEWYN